MPVELKQLQPNVYVMSFHGRVKITELEDAYQKAIALKDASYLLVNGTNMVYENEVMFSEKLLALMQQNVAKESTKGILVVLPDNPPVREPITQLYDNFDYLHKLHFVPTQDDGIQLVNQWLKA